MKKIISFLILLAIAGGGWLKYSSDVKRIEKSVQGDPVRTVSPGRYDVIYR